MEGGVRGGSRCKRDSVNYKILARSVTELWLLILFVNCGYDS